MALNEHLELGIKGLSNFLLSNMFTGGKVDTTLFTKGAQNNILIVQIYIDDIIFSAKNAKTIMR